MTSLIDFAKSESKKFKESTIVLLNADNPIKKVDVIPTGSFSVDTALGIGGYPRGAIVELAGGYGSGKTTMALHAVLEAQKLGLVAVYVDFEHALNPDYAESLGIDLDRMLLVQESIGERAFGIIRDAIETVDNLGLVIVDSVAAVTTNHELTNEIGDSHIGQVARLLSSANKILSPICLAKNVCMIYINQFRANIGGYGTSEVTTGGRSVKYFTKVIMRLGSGGKIEKAGETIGQVVTVKTDKNKYYAPYKKGDFRLIYGNGIDRGYEVVRELIRRGILVQSGSWFKLGDETIGQGQDKVYENHREMLENLLLESNERITENGETLPEEALRQGRDQQPEL